MGEGEGMARHSGHRKNSYMFLEKRGGGGCFFVNLCSSCALHDSGPSFKHTQSPSSVCVCARVCCVADWQL